MDGENKAWVLCITAIAIGAITMTAVVQTKDYNVKKAAFENGYEQVMLPGSSYYRWQKVSCEGCEIRLDEEK